MICVPIIAKTTESAIEEIKEAEKLADILELRIDYLQNPDLAALLRVKTKPVIITNRKKGEGGNFTGSEADRLAILEKAIDEGAEYIDIEWSCGLDIIKKFNHITKGTKTRIICSWHNFQSTPKNLPELYQEMKEKGIDIIKIVTMANSINDNVIIFNLLAQAKKDKQDIITLCMGAHGEISRILSPLMGSYLTFASLHKGKESAPGQIEARVLKTFYRVPKLKGNSLLIFGLIGNPVNKSQGYRIFNKAFNHSGLNNIYINFLVEDVASFLDNFRNYFSGLSVTMPHKQEILHYIDNQDPILKSIGAVNTIVKKNSQLIGYNTDYLGALQAIEAHLPLAEKKVTLLGAGGVSRAIAYGILKKGGNLLILNRTIEKARQLADELGCAYGGLEEVKDLDCDLLINGTSIGMAPKVDLTPVPRSCLKASMIVFDTIYNPLKTRLLKDAQEQGCATISGVEMFLQQAAVQFTLWTGLEAPIEIMRSAIEDEPNNS